MWVTAGRSCPPSHPPATSPTLDQPPDGTVSLVWIPATLARPPRKKSKPNRHHDWQLAHRLEQRWPPPSRMGGREGIGKGGAFRLLQPWLPVTCGAQHPRWADDGQGGLLPAGKMSDATENPWGWGRGGDPSVSKHFFRNGRRSEYAARLCRIKVEAGWMGGWWWWPQVGSGAGGRGASLVAVESSAGALQRSRVTLERPAGGKTAVPWAWQRGQPLDPGGNGGLARSRADVAGTSFDARRRPRRLPLPRGAAGGHRSGVALDASCQGGGGFLHGRGLRGATNGSGGLGAWRGADKTGVTHLREWPRLPAAAQGVSVPTYRRVSALTRRHDDCLNTTTHTPSRCFVLCKAAPATHQTVLAGSSEAMPRLFTHKRAKYMAKKLLRARRPPATDCPPPRLEHTSQIRSVPLVEAHPVSCLQRGRRRVHIEMRGTGLSHFDI